MSHRTFQNENLCRIDVHHHCIPQCWRKNAKEHGLHAVAGAPLPDWTPELSLELMEQMRISKAILSLSAPGVHLGTQEEAVTLARDCNEEVFSICQKDPEHFGLWAVLPMPFVDQACAEAVYALDTLSACGVVLLGSTDGVFLGDPRFEPLMAELNRRKAVVFVHPNLHASSQTILPHIPGFFVEFLCDTTRAAMNLIFSGTLAKYPDIKFILSHAGGFLPYIAWRLSLADYHPEAKKIMPQGVLHYIKSFYFDTALSTSPYAINLLKDLVGEEHILFGSDFPFAPRQVVDGETQAFNKITEAWSDQTRKNVNCGNFLRLSSGSISN